MLRIGEQLGIAVVVGANDFLLVDRHVEGAANADVVEWLLIDAHGQESAAGGEPSVELQRRRALLQAVDILPANVLHDVDLSSAQASDAGRLILDDAIDDLVDIRE